jgi:hypothetical protein
MEKHLKTHLQIINHIINQHPELLKPIMLLVQKKYNQSQLESNQLKEIFTAIYQQNKWGNKTDADFPFFSGDGSHKEHVVSPYVKAVSEFIGTLNYTPNVLDLGCGDFNIGSQLRSLCASYVAYDVVDDIISFNKIKYSNMNVDFQVKNIVEDTLVGADIVFVRQVLQHLSNAEILKIIPKLMDNYKWLILTEHVPKNKDFIPNVDHATGQYIRLSKKSGIIITLPPFNLHVLEEKVICEVEDYNGLIRTFLYRLR